MVDIELMDKKDALYPFVRDGTWPTPKVIQDYGDKWHKLPLIKCFEVPDFLDPSQIYSDKSYSMNKSEVIAHVASGSKLPIPTKKVLDTMINSPATNWTEFLAEVDKFGLMDDDYIIGLKEKERELKPEGRFFSLMSWMLREYFVITEYLIKENYLPLFNGITMADDLTTLTKKLLDKSSGQGLTDYSVVTYANHIDYKKWNAKQRHEANGPVFCVMGQFLGYPNLIEQTHPILSKCTFYYNQRPDLMRVVDGELENKSRMSKQINEQR